MHPERAFCRAHLIRDIRFPAEQTDRSLARWGEKLLLWIRKLFDTWHRAGQMTQRGFALAMDRLRRGFLQAVRRPPSRAEARTLANRFRGSQADNYFLFLTTPAQMETDAQRFGGFDPYDVACRDLLSKYWMKPSSDVSPSDANSLRGLCTHFQNMSIADTTVGEQLKRVNALLQLHCMLDDALSLEKDFHEYISLLVANGLGRMILFGGQNVIETTIRWGSRAITRASVSQETTGCNEAGHWGKWESRE